MTHARTISNGGLTGRHVLAGFIAFFGVIFAVNGYMMYRALSTHAGVVAVEPYRKGLAYNDRIAADERQARLGWTGDIGLERDGALAVDLRDGRGAALAGLKVEAVIGRPATNAQDRPLALREGAPGRYVGAAGALGEGNWIVSVEVGGGPAAGEPVYRMRKRLWLKP